MKNIVLNNAGDWLQNEARLALGVDPIECQLMGVNIDEYWQAHDLPAYAVGLALIDHAMIELECFDTPDKAQQAQNRFEQFKAADYLGDLDVEFLGMSAFVMVGIIALDIDVDPCQFAEVNDWLESNFIEGN